MSEHEHVRLGEPGNQSAFCAVCGYEVAPPVCTKCGTPFPNADRKNPGGVVAGSNEAGYPRVQGRCPMGCGSTLFLGAGGYVTCSLIGCPDPGRADKLLHAEESAPRKNRLVAEWTEDGLVVTFVEPDGPAHA